MSENTQTPEQENQQSVYDRFEGPFDAIAYLLMTARLGMENANAEGELPRYVRIARAQEVLNSSEIPSWAQTPAEWAKNGVEGLNIFIPRLITLTLQARDVLKGADAFIALAEIALEMIEVATSSEFWAAVGNALDPANDDSISIPSNTVVPWFQSNLDIDVIKNWLAYIPNPEDLNRIGHELYRMSCLAYKDNNTIDIQSTGKLRLLQYTFGQTWGIYNSNGDPAAGADYLLTTKLGQEETEAFSGDIIEYEPEGGGSAIELFTPTPPVGKLGQEDEVTAILDALEYNLMNKNDNIRLFQKVNDLPTVGQLNEETINRFFNLDSENKNLVWAQIKVGTLTNAERYPMGFLDLVNGNADDYINEGLIPLRENESKYQYYKIRTETNFPPDGEGWVSKVPNTEGDVTYINGFVAMESRFISASREKNGPLYEGGLLSEGEAASGRFFFAARHTEPWIPGRNGTPASTAVYNDAQTAPTPGHISRMHQDVEESITDLLSKAPSGELIDDYNIAFEASCLRRSLYTDRSGVKKILGQPDQGRILLEVYEDDNTTPAWSDPHIAEKDGWQPGPQVTSAFLNDAQINQRNNWFRQTSNTYVIEAASLIDGDTNGLTIGDALSLTFTIQELRFRVILEGKHSSAWDTDAYFDDIRLKWMFVPKPA